MELGEELVNAQTRGLIARRSVDPVTLPDQEEWRDLGAYSRRSASS